MNDVVTMIHIPDNVEIRLTDLLAHLRMMLETFDDSIKLYREDWQFNFDDKEKSTAVYGYDLFANSHWEKGVENLQNKEVAHLWAVFQCSINGVRISNRNVIGINAVLLPHTEFLRLPRENGEKWICIRIPMCIWTHVKQNVFKEELKSMCVALGSTYACVDIEAPLGGIFEGWFREFADDSEINCVNIEDKLPGIYWCQLVSERMLSSTGKIEDIIKDSPFECAEILGSDSSRLLWIEIANSIKEATYKKRLTMRHLFDASLYRISLDKLCHFNSVYWGNILNAPPFLAQHRKKLMKRIPLTKDEIDAVMNQANGNDKCGEARSGT